MTAPDRYTPEEYLALERNAEFRSEYIAGRVVPKAPGETRPHNLIVTALVSELHGYLIERPGEVYCSRQRVKVSASGDYLYPDVVVSCNPLFEDSTSDTLLNPELIVEVLSEASEGYDRGKKFACCRRIDSLQEFVFISEKKPLVEQYVRQGDVWRFIPTDNIDAAMNLASVDLRIPLLRIYRKALMPTRRRMDGFRDDPET
ncbi:MAG TPA: Uma2 family endonuclease [Longimicrobium sp.]|jgi:Uma2 family endonuclease|uniref:Uma2 family endonuclease n=1 Tax=Longimicrobium sp. TaxID=2029185 RepID=UPI002EDADBE6